MMQLQTSSLVAQTAAFFNAVGRSKSIAANGHLPLFSATTLMGLPFNNFLCRIFRRLSQTHQTRAEINSGPLTLNAPNRGGGFVSVYRLATRNLALFVKNLMLQGFQPVLDPRRHTKFHEVGRLSSCVFVQLRGSGVSSYPIRQERR